jgi:hypothetical protein
MAQWGYSRQHGGAIVARLRVVRECRRKSMRQISEIVYTFASMTAVSERRRAGSAVRADLLLLLVMRIECVQSWLDMDDAEGRRGGSGGRCKQKMICVERQAKITESRSMRGCSCKWSGLRVGAAHVLLCFAWLLCFFLLTVCPSAGSFHVLIRKSSGPVSTAR